MPFGAQSSQFRLVMAATLAAIVLAAICFAPSARASGATAVGWGYNEYGEVGNGTTTTTGCDCISTPVPVSGLSEATQIAGGEYHGLAVTSDGTAKSWGYNYYGELGNGTTSSRTTPGPVSGLSNVVAVAGGAYHSLALLSNGTVMAWGYNEYGQLGRGVVSGPEECEGYGCSKVPVAVPGIANAVAVAAGYYTSYALLSNGTVMAWGNDRNGQMGDGGFTEGCECRSIPIQVPGVASAIAVSAGEETATALISNGSVMAWGKNSYGQSGNGTTNTTGCECSAPVTVSGITTATGIASGAEFNLARLADGTVKGWGINYDSQLATETAPEDCSGYDCAKTPIQLNGLGNIQSLAAFGYAGIALVGDGTARTWGYAYYGELGNGTNAESFTPGAVSLVSGASAVGAGEYTGYALIGPSQTLTVALVGAGAAGGSVTGREVSCPTRCTGKYPQGQVALLTPSPTGFAGFSGPCTGTATCQAKMDADQTVTATYGVPAGTKITKAKILSPKKKATFSFSAPGAITGYQCKLNRPKPKPKKGKAKKPKKPKFASCKSSKLYKNLKPGKYTFQVRALDVLGADTKPAKRAFKIHPPKKKKHAKH